MELLQQIISSSVDGDQPVSGLLRYLKVFAVRSRAIDLAEWVSKERDGYREEDTLPVYRGPFNTQVLAQLYGPRGSNIERFPVPRSGFPDEMRALFEVRFRQSVTALEEFIGNDKSSLSIPWPADAVAHTNALVDEGKVSYMELHQYATVRQVVPRTLIVSALDVVRNRILDLALELEQVIPTLDDANVGQDRREQVSAVYQTIIQAQNAYIGEHSTVQKTLNIQVTPGDSESLSRYLDGINGLTDDQKREIVGAAVAAKPQGADAIENDGRLKATLKWVGSLAGKTIQEGANLAIKLALEHWLGPAS